MEGRKLNLNEKMIGLSKNKFIITGGPGFGITTIIEELSKLGIQTVREAARYVINNEIAKKSDNLPWKNRDGFDLALSKQKLLDYKTDTNGKYLFFDRGLPDFVGWRKYLGLSSLAFIEDIYNNPYEKKVFMTVPWKEIYIENEFRPIKFEESKEIYNYLLKGYHEIGYQTILIPKLTAADRAQFILNNLKHNK